MTELIAPRFEFHVSRQSRDRYQFDDALFVTNGNVIFTNFYGARLFAQKMNAKRDLISFPEKAVKAGQINAMGLIDEALHMVAAAYRRQIQPDVLAQALEWMSGMIGDEAVDKTLRSFLEEYPPISVYRREQTIDEYLAGTSGELTNREVTLEEITMLWLGNLNPAFAPYNELFDDSDLKRETSYVQITSLLHAFFESMPTFGPEGQNLIDLLRAPALASPYSLTGQLEYLRTRFGSMIGSFLFRLLGGLDLVREEEKPVFGTGGGQGVPAAIFEFSGQVSEPERFSPDRDWMPSLVLMAKNSYVWLDQLSKKYRRNIFRLDHIPNEELDSLARWGVTGLWLIGLWERSIASKTIKQMRGNPEAVASAYSLMDYAIAADLGGDEAYDDLRRRAWQRGIRLASDMVPNHMGIDSKWVIEHPEWFIGQDYSPFPSYSFNGPNLSWDGRVGLYIEDHYFDNTDAAVVFKRVDFWSGDTKYIYHGNDGTSMPWNDTAQLNYLKPEVREAVIQTILHVARKFPIIRFDAAMTLAKKHFQRLWFPEPGTGGDIASRSDHAITKEQFDAAIPVEFWREVVDRVAQEVPDTLLLAEAFWLMEGYFVRTLGMHRVYNSAFMNMLRDEKNAEYRLGIKNTLEFDPDILKRYVNFMNNPDERTAVDQFGKGDKYFGVCMLMNTLPGLPMIGHGQVEGFTEKYGMEYRRAYWDEQVDGYLVERHEREIFPLMRKRYLFAGSDNFLLYDVNAPEGFINEDVYAFSNRAGQETALVLYHNKFATARGWINQSSPYTIKHPDGSKETAQQTLAQGLGLVNDPEMYTIFRDQISGMEIIRNNQELHARGLFIELEAYKYRVYTNIRQVKDNEWRQYAHVAEYLGGGSVSSIDDTVKEIFLAPVHAPYRELVNAGMFQWIISNRVLIAGEAANAPAALDEAEIKTRNLIQAIQSLLNQPAQPEAIAISVRHKLSAAMHLPTFEEAHPGAETEYLAAIRYIQEKPSRSSIKKEPGKLVAGDLSTWGTLLGWIFSHELGKLQSAAEYEEISRAWIDEWMLGRIIGTALRDMAIPEADAWRATGIVRLLTRHHSWWQPMSQPMDEISGATDKVVAYPAPSPTSILRIWLSDRDVQSFISMNRHQDILWFNKEAFEEWLWWMFLVAVLDLVDAHEPEEIPARVIACYQVIQQLQKAKEASDYQVEKLLMATQAS